MEAGRPRALRNRVDLESLRARIRAIELDGGGHGAVPLAPEIDRALPWGGLLRGALHEIAAAPVAVGAATGFAAALAGRLAGARGLVLWCLARGDLYAPGLPALGLDPVRLVVVRARAPESLWVAEEALRSGRLAAVVCEADADLVASRRLQLAARAHGTACLLLAHEEAAAATTRWRIAAAPQARWRVELARCRGGRPGHWTVGWDHAGGFAVAAPLADRPLPHRLAN